MLMVILFGFGFGFCKFSGGIANLSAAVMLMVFLFGLLSLSLFFFCKFSGAAPSLPLSAAVARFCQRVRLQLWFTVFVEYVFRRRRRFRDHRRRPDAGSSRWCWVPHLLFHTAQALQPKREDGQEKTPSAHETCGAHQPRRAGTLASRPWVSPEGGASSGKREEEEEESGSGTRARGVD